MEEKRNQELKLISRQNLSVNGVVEVTEFDDSCVTLKTICGELTIDGKNMKISVLDTDKGVVTLDGEIDAIIYSNDAKADKRGFWGKMFS